MKYAKFSKLFVINRRTNLLTFERSINDTGREKERFLLPFCACLIGRKSLLMELCEEVENVSMLEICLPEATGNIF